MAHQPYRVLNPDEGNRSDVEVHHTQTGAASADAVGAPTNPKLPFAIRPFVRLCNVASTAVAFNEATLT